MPNQITNITDFSLYAKIINLKMKTLGHFDHKDLIDHKIGYCEHFAIGFEKQKTVKTHDFCLI